jgi:5'-3' exonuclease
MEVLPPQSVNVRTPKFQNLMLDETSLLKQFFPTRFRERSAWRVIVLLPSIDADLMVTTIEKVDLELTEGERHRKTFGRTMIFTEPEKVWSKVEKIDGNKFFFEYPIVTQKQELPSVLPKA